MTTNRRITHKITHVNWRKHIQVSGSDDASSLKTLQRTVTGQHMRER